MWLLHYACAGPISSKGSQEANDAEVEYIEAWTSDF